MFHLFGRKDGPKKARRRHGLWWWMAFSFAFCIGVLLGINIALLVFASTSVVAINLLQGLSGGTVLAYLVSLFVAALLGAAFLIGYLWTFAGASSTYEAARAYEEEYVPAWPWPRLLVGSLEAFFIVLDLLSLSYRREFFAAKGADQLFWFFVVLSLLSPVLGLLMHILENKPLNYRLAEMRQLTANLVGDDIEEAIRSMPTDKRTRVLFDRSGEELADYFEQLRNAEQSKQAESGEAEQERKRRQRSARSPLAFGSLEKAGQGSQGSRLNGNGHQ